jgi:hypothetical protein
MGELHQSSFLRPSSSANSDAVLLSLGEQLVLIAAELNRNVDCIHEELVDESRMKDDENVLARLAPIERAIMETPASTLAGLGVKARHVGYVLSEYWEVPIDQIDWEARAVRLLIESICSITHTPLLWRDATHREQPSHNSTQLRSEA